MSNADHDYADHDNAVPRHPIRVVAHRTGLKPDLIRAWERRYEAVAPGRDRGNQRLYSDRDVARLLLLRDAVRRGRKIGQVAGLTDDELTVLVTEDQRLVEARAEPGDPAIEPAGEGAGRVERFIAVLKQLESVELGLILEQAGVELGPRRVVLELAVPIVDRVRELSDGGALRPMHVSLARNVVRSFLSELAGRGALAARAAPPILVAGAGIGAPDDLEPHVLLAIAACDGWRTTYLGAGLPAEEIVAAAHEVGSRCLVVEAGGDLVGSRAVAEVARIRRLLSPEVPVLVGGRGLGATDPWGGRDGGSLQVVPLERLNQALADLRSASRHAQTGTPTMSHPHHVPEPGAPAADAEREAAILPLNAEARRRYALGPELLGPDGCLELGSINAVRRLAYEINRKRDVERFPERGLSAGQLNAAALIHDFSHRLIARYSAEHGIGAMHEALSWLEGRHGAGRLATALECFVEQFDYRLSGDAAKAAGSASGGAARRVGADLVLEEMVVVWLAGQNPALAALADLMDDTVLEQKTGYRTMMADLGELFASRPGYGAGRRSLLQLLRLPFEESPRSLAGQLEVLIRLEGELSHQLARRLLLGLDLLREENAPRFQGPGGPGEAGPEGAGPEGPGRREEPRLDPDPARSSPARSSPARYSPERPWMATLVMEARHTLVWLDQLSRRHGRAINRLDQIPDAELAQLASRGMTGLWLVGVWERSQASGRIKQATGNPEAEASAYALSEYKVAARLGGETALEDLTRRARRYGIRLGCDVVANHMGLDSPWVVEHPERFLSLPESPFPAYTFDGPDLASDLRVGLYIADQYYDRSDAAVVFKRVERSTGEVRYLYHGNDGTSLPWNDTAQLDYLRADVREAMISTVLEVAERFPIIRFDAAMTLARQHIQRLWHPPAGAGGAIPSRAGRGVSPAELDRLMPDELWRDLVDRVTEAAPDTLLLAEAFWLMEGYFARSLGMHRVYNSAFMHMIRDQDNARFRGVLRHILELDPGMLGRFASFVTTPDEQPAAAQLGTGDRYFCACALMVTLPGTPLFGHGQIEGLKERYGMEYGRAYVDEVPDPAMVDRHMREIVPLLGLRSSLSSGERFRLYDFERIGGGSGTGDGSAASGNESVNEDVIAFANRGSGEIGRGRSVLVLVNNCAKETRGQMRRSAPFREPSGRSILQADLAATLGLGADTTGRITFRDAVTGELLQLAATDLQQHGVRLELGPYQVRVLVELERDGC